MFFFGFDYIRYTISTRNYGKYFMNYCLQCKILNNNFDKLQDPDCLICYEPHASTDCPERTEQHCHDCHAYIRVCSDHTSVCGTKTWLYEKYAELYVNQPKQRFVLSVNAPFRFLMNKCWRKGTDGLNMYSPATGAFFQYKSEYDLTLLSNRFVGIRIVVVVKESGRFVEKLVLLTSKTKLIVAAQVDNEFNRNNAHHVDWHTTLYLAMSGKDKPIININAFPNGKMARQFVLQYDQDTKRFKIPVGLDVNVAGYGSDVYASDIQTNAQLDKPLDGAQCLEMVEFDANIRNRLPTVGLGNQLEENRANSNCMVCYGLHHSVECQRGKLGNCYECHVPIKHYDDHAQNCGAKQFFFSEKVDKYVMIPSTRCIISFEAPINISLNGKIQMAQPGMQLFSSMSDAYFKFESSSKLIVMTTGYSRIRLPIVVQEGLDSIERLVLFTSHDRAILAALGCRTIVNENYFGDYQHNTPLVLHTLQNPSDLTVEVHSAGGRINAFKIAYRRDKNKFEIPLELDVKSKHFPPMTFDAPQPIKMKRH